MNYVGKDLANTIDYFGSAKSILIVKEDTIDQRRGFYY